MPLKRILVGAALLALLTWLALRPPPSATVEDTLVARNLPVLGTWVTLSVYAEDPGLQARAQQVFDRIALDLGAFEQRWRAFGDGELGRFNQTLDAGGIARVPDEMLPLFERALQLARDSGWRFDPRVGRLVGVWGFDDEAHYRESPPAQADIDAALAALQAAPEALVPCADDAAARCYGPAPGVRWDFGAIAKGDAVDQAAARLLDAGIDHFMINAGGNVNTHGRHGDRPWRIAIRHPRPGLERMLAILEPADENVVTSGDYERYFEVDGLRYHHLLDPASGQPARGLQAVSIVDADGALADAASTALFVAGPGHWREAARALGLEQVLVVDADGRLAATAALAARLTLPGDPPLAVVP